MLYKISFFHYNHEVADTDVGEDHLGGVNSLNATDVKSITAAITLGGKAVVV